MNPIKSQFIRNANEYLKSELINNRLAILTSVEELDPDLEFDKSILTNVFFDFTETWKHSADYKEYTVLVCIFECGDKKIEIEFDVDGSFECQPRYEYTINYDSFNGADIEVDDKKEGFYAVLNYITFKNFVLENNDIFALMREQETMLAVKYSSKIKNFIPGIERVDAYSLDKLKLVFENGFELQVEIRSLDDAISSHLRKCQHETI